MKYCQNCGTGSIKDKNNQEKSELKFTSGMLPQGKIQVEKVGYGDIIAIVGIDNEWFEITGVSLINTTTGVVELASYCYYGDLAMCYAASQEYFVIAWRNVKVDDLKGTQFKIKNRNTQEEKTILVQGIKSRVESMHLFGSTLITFPNESGKCLALDPEPIGRIYTMDLSADNPEDTLLNFEIPVCEARFFGKHQVVFRIGGKQRETFNIFSLPEERKV